MASYVCYKCLASPPLHWWYDPLTTTTSTASSSLYLPGGGFSGLFYHLGVLERLLDTRQNNNDWDYYCYSSGCIAAVAALTNLTLEDTTNAGIATQREWRAGRVSIYDFAEQFTIRLLETVDDATLQAAALPHLKVIVTSPWHGGTEILQATHRDDFVRLMVKTTWLYVIL